MASAMLSEGGVTSSPEELEAWIAARPEFRGPLEAGGFGTRFDAADLFPLLEAFLSAATATPTDALEKRGPQWEYWLWGLLLVILVAIAWVIAA
jgi:hypothetical protein